MTLKDFEGKTVEQIQEELSKEMADYEAQMTTKTLDELKEEEKSLMEKFKENDAYIKKRKYNLPGEITVEITKGVPEKITPKEMRKCIVEFLGTIESEWKTSLGIFQMMTFWNGKETEIPYGTLDSTLRTLGSVVKYKGMRELENIFKVNNWLSNIHEDFMKDTMYIQYLSGLHQTIMNNMDKFNKETDTEEA